MSTEMTSEGNTPPYPPFTHLWVWPKSFSRGSGRRSPLAHPRFVKSNIPSNPVIRITWERPNIRYKRDSLYPGRLNSKNLICFGHKIRYNGVNVYKLLHEPYLRVTTIAEQQQLLSCIDLHLLHMNF